MSLSKKYSVLGLDPGLRCTGYSLIQTGPEGYNIIDCGTLKSSTKDTISDRLKDISKQLQGILNEYLPDQAALEETFMAQNPKSALLLGHIRGALLLTISLLNIPAFEYSPREVKMAIVGYGAADKYQVRSMLQNILHSNLEEYPLDATDALAVAVCHIHTTGQRWKKDLSQ